MKLKTPLFDWENWREIGVTLARNKTRTFMTAFGIFWGTAMLAMLLGGASGLEAMLRYNFNGFATNTAVMFAERTTMSHNGYNKGTSWYITTTDVDNIRKGIPELKAVSANESFSATVAYRTLHDDCTIIGADSEYPKVFEPIVYSGRFINAGDDLTDRKVCVIGKNVADKLFGSESPIGKHISIRGIYFKIVGVVGQTSEISVGGRLDESVVIPINLARRAFNMGNNVGGLMIVAPDGTTPSDFRNRIQHILSSSHPPVSQDDLNAMFFMDVSEQFKMVDNLFLGITLLALFVGVGTLMAGVIGVGNIMWVIVKERTQEIGIRRAIGAKPRDIITQVLSEGVVLTLVAGLAGISFAAIVLYAVAQITVRPDGTILAFQLSFSTAVKILLAFVVLGTAAGFIPAWRAMKIKPIEALNDEV